MKFANVRNRSLSISSRGGIVVGIHHCIQAALHHIVRPPHDIPVDFLVVAGGSVHGKGRGQDGQ